MKVSAIIPAAGNSERMGTCKTLLTFHNGTTFADHLCEFFTGNGCSPVILIVNAAFAANRPVPDNVLQVINSRVHLGRFHSIQLGIQHVPEDVACFIQNVDNPYTEPGLLSLLINAIEPGNYAVPVYKGKAGHPILLGSNIVRTIRGRHGDADFREILRQFTRIEIPHPSDQILWNINTPADYKEFLCREHK